MGDGQVTFSREDFAAVQTALDNACRALAFAFPEGVDAQTRAAIAGSILEFASSGVFCPVRLCAHALGKMQPRQAAYAQKVQVLHLATSS